MLESFGKPAQRLSENYQERQPRDANAAAQEQSPVHQAAYRINRWADHKAENEEQQGHPERQENGSEQHDAPEQRPKADEIFL